MSIIYQIPHNSQSILTANVFQAQFNNTVPGAYNFADPYFVPVSIPPISQQNQIAVNLTPGAIYLVERISVGGTISAEDYLSALNPLSIPQITFKKLLGNEPIHQFPIPIVQFYDGLEIGFWIRSDKGNDALTLSISGQLIQNEALVGIPIISLSVAMVIYQVDEQKYNSSFRNTIGPDLANGIRGY